MKSNLRWLLLGICVFGLTWLMGGNATTPLVQAAPGDHWARWLIETDFPNNTIDTRLIIQLGHTTMSGDDIVDREEYFPATCETVGKLVIQNETAVFDGSSYITCDIDSIQDRVFEMSNGAILLPDECAAKRPFFMAKLAIENNPANVNGINPIFQRDDMAFAVPFNPVNGQAKMIVSYADIVAQSTPFLTTGAEQHLRTVFQDNQVWIRPKFEVDGVEIPSNPTLLASQPIMLSNLESTITIGYAITATGQEEYFEGELTDLRGDPHCDGKG